MRHLVYLQLLLFSVLYQLRAETRVKSNWSTHSSNTKLLGLFPQQVVEESKNDMWTIHCRSMFRAAIVLSQQYNIKFQGQYLDYEEILTDNDIMVTIDHTCKQVSISNIVGFVGPAYSSEARYLASFANRLGVLSISYSATSPDLSTINTGSFYRTVPSDENTALSITILFEQYKWKSCIIIYQNDEYGYNGMKLLIDKFNELNINTFEKIKFDINEQNFQIDLQKTLKNSLSRIVIVWANEKSSEIILKEALKYKLVGPHFVWILTTTLPLEQFNPQQKEELIGIITVEPINADAVEAPINNTLLDEAYNIWQTNEPNTFPGHNNVNSYALFTFDATWALILSLQKLCSTQLSCLEFLNVSDCVSGQIKFSNETIDRIDNIHYIIKNIQRLNTEENTIDYIPVLKWDITLTNWIYYKNNSNDILWPNLSKKIPSDHKLIQGQELRIAIIEGPPWIILKNPTVIYNNMIDKNYTQIDLTEFDGFFKDVLVYLQNQMGFIPIVMLAKPTIQYDELVQGVANNLHDTVMTSITITVNRSQIVGFSIALIPSSIRFAVRKPDSGQLDYFFFLKPFSPTLWLVLLGIICYSSVLIWFVEGRNRNNNNNNNGLSIGQSFTYVICTLLGKGDFARVRTTAGRVLTYALYALQIIIFALYLADITSRLIKQRSDPIISGIDDIKNGKISPNRIGIVAGSQIETYYLNSISQGKKDYYLLKTSNEVYTKLIHGDIDVALWSNVSIAYHVNNIYCDLMTVGVDFSHSLYHLPVKKDWLYTEDLNSNLLSLIGSDELDRLLMKWSQKYSCQKTDLYGSQKTTITITATGGLLLTFFITTITVILIHFVTSMANFIRAYNMLSLHG